MTHQPQQSFRLNPKDFPETRAAYNENGGGCFIVISILTGNGLREWSTPVVRIICPAWQVEDLLRNLQKICSSAKIEPAKTNELIEEITNRLILLPDTAYQKIEEYLWEILK